MTGSRRTTWNFYSANRLLFGRGAVREIAAAVGRWQPDRVLIVTDRALIERGIAGRVESTLRQAGMTVRVFDGGEPEPSLNAAAAAFAFANDFRPDTVVGVGGGSNMDLSKITAALLSHGGEPADYFGFDRIPGPTVPLVCVPTTSGTGSEVSHAAVLTDTDARIKVSTLSPYLRPTLAVVDPELTVTCPRKTTADSGIDALTHAIEACTAVDFDKLDVPAGEMSPYDGRNPLGDCLADKAIELIGRHLVTAVREPDNMDAREGMSLAATLAGLAFSNCAVAVVHALEYPLGGVLHCSHGAGNGLLLPFVMRYNLAERIPTFARIAALLGEDVDDCSEHAAADRAIVAVDRLKRDIGIPARIRDIGGTEQQLPEFARKAFAIKRLMLLNPRPPTERDLLEILRLAL